MPAPGVIEVYCRLILSISKVFYITAENNTLHGNKLREHLSYHNHSYHIIYVSCINERDVLTFFFLPVTCVRINDDDDDDIITNLQGRPSNGAQQRLTKCCKIK